MKKIVGVESPFCMSVAPPLIPKVPEIVPLPQKQPDPEIPEEEPTPLPEINPHETPETSPASPEIEEPEKNPFTDPGEGEEAS